MSYELLPHTADARAVLRAPDRRALLQAAVDLIRELIVGESQVEPATRRVLGTWTGTGPGSAAGSGLVAAPGSAGGSGLVAAPGSAGTPDEAEGFFLLVRELVYLHDVEGFLPATVVETEPATVSGEEFDESRHSFEHHLKALTRHGYRFERGPVGYAAEMVFDL